MQLFSCKCIWMCDCVYGVLPWFVWSKNVCKLEVPFFPGPENFGIFGPRSWRVREIYDNGQKIICRRGFREKQTNKQEAKWSKIKGSVQNLFNLRPLPDLVQIIVPPATCSKSYPSLQIMHAPFISSTSHLHFHGWQAVTWSGKMVSKNRLQDQSLGIWKWKILYAPCLCTAPFRHIT